jgi:hypothetical protein
LILVSTPPSGSPKNKNCKKKKKKKNPGRERREEKNIETKEAIR